MPSRRVLQLGFLASHRGTNLQAILDACKTGRLQARPRVVISNNSDSGAYRKSRFCVGGCYDNVITHV